MRCKVGPAWLWSKSAMLLCFSLSASAHAAEPLRVVLEVSPPHQTLDNGKVGGLTTAVVEQMLQQAGLSAQRDAVDLIADLDQALSR